MIIFTSFFPERSRQLKGSSSLSRFSFLPCINGPKKARVGDESAAANGKDLPMEKIGAESKE